MELNKPQELSDWAKSISGKTRQELDEVIRHEMAEQIKTEPRCST